MKSKEIYLGIEEHFEAMLSREGKTHVHEKRQILNMFLEMEDHCTVKDIAHRLEIEGVFIPEKLIQDTMESFCQYGIARKRQFQDREPLYEHFHPGAHHDHLVCVQCGKIIEFADNEMEKMKSQVARQQGFYPLHHKMELYGLCSRCFEERKPFLPLAQASPGEHLRIEQFLGGRGMASRLLSLGLTKGTRLEVVANQGFGPVLIAVRGGRLALGREMAQKIMVCPAGEGDFQEEIETIGESEEKEGSSLEDAEAKTPVEKNLSQLRQGQKGVIKQVMGEGHFRHRLMEMGFTPGSEVYVEKYAPLKNPIEYIIKGYHVSLRRDEAARVIMEDNKAPED